MLPPRFLETYEYELGFIVLQTRLEHEMATTAIDRLRGKFLQARGVAQRVASNMEAEADSLIAAEDEMKSETAAAFAPHKEILGEAKSELAAIKDALNLMSNGGPPLDAAEPIATGSPSPAPASAPPITPDKPRIDTGAVEHITLQNGETA